MEWINLHSARQAELLPIVGATDREAASINNGGMPQALHPSEDKNKVTMNHKQAASIADSTQPTRKSPSSGKPTSRTALQVHFIPDLISDEACCNEKAIAELNIYLLGRLLIVSAIARYIRIAVLKLVPMLTAVMATVRRHGLPTPVMISSEWSDADRTIEWSFHA